MNARMLVATALAAAAATVTATNAAAATAALLNCGKVPAAGRSWQVEAAGVPCRTARGIVRAVAVQKPDRVIHARGGEIDQYAAAFSGLACVKSGQAKVGRAINCTSKNGKRSVYGISKG